MEENSFKPAWWLPGPHLQTIWPLVFRRQIKNLITERERFELPDGDFIDLDWVGRNQIGPIVIILHGLEGSINSHYAKGMLHSMAKQNWRGVFMNFRGCSGIPNRLPRCYHSGETSDLSLVVNSLTEREPHTPFAAIGFSLGGNVLLKWLGETGQNNQMKAAIAISVPFELEKAVKKMEQGFSKIYQWYMLKCLHKRLIKKFPTLQKARTLKEFDDNVTAPLHGFSGADEYYMMASSRQYLKKIQVPTLLVHSVDDPFVTADVIPARDELSSFIEMELTKSGGHVGFIAGKFPWWPEYWLEQRASAFFRHYLGR